MGKFKKKMNPRRNAEFKRENFGKMRGGGRNKKWVFMNNLSKPNWDEIPLEPMRKDFYKENPQVTARDEAAIAEYRKQNAISVKGTGCPKPVEAFSECSFPGPVMTALKAQGFTCPTPIQSQAIPIALSGRDMVGIAETGSGKTLAYILPAVIHIMEKGPSSRNHGEPDIVVLSPTRELAQQIHEVTKSLRPHVQVTSECFYGGTRRVDQKLHAQKVLNICIATPGRMVDFLYEELVKLNRCTYFVLDEADRMLDMGFEPQIKRVIEQCRPDRQMLMFSATWPQEIQQLAESYLKDYIMVNIGSFQISANHNITQKIEVCEETDKTNKLVELMKDVMKEQDRKTLIFVNSKLDVDLLTLKFRLNGWAALGLHGSKKQEERDRVFADFKKGRTPILIATDLAARGLDVDDIKFIINYDFPPCAEDYVHRIGRTGRCNRTGTAISLFTPSDRDKANALISVLEEANQAVDTKLREMLKLPALTKAERKRGPKPVHLKMRKKQLKRLVNRSQVNRIPLGTQTDTDKLPDLDDISPDILADAFSGTKKKHQKRLDPGHNQVIDPPCNYGAPEEQGKLKRFQEKSSLIDFVQHTYGNLIPRKKLKKMEQKLSNCDIGVFMPGMLQDETIQNPNQATNQRDSEFFRLQPGIERGFSASGASVFNECGRQNMGLPIERGMNSPGIERGFSASGASVFNEYGRQNMGLPMDNRNMKIPANPRSMSAGVGNVPEPWISQTERPVEPRYMERPSDFRNSSTPMGPVHIEPFENVRRNNATMPFVRQNNYTGMNQNNYTGMNQNNYTGMNQNNYTGTSQSNYTGTSQSNYTGMNQKDYAGMNQKDYTSMNQKDYAGVNQKDYAGVNQKDYTGMNQKDYAGMNQKDYAGMNQKDYAAMNQKDYAGMSQKSYTGISQNSYTGMSQNSYTGISQSNYTGMNQSNYNMKGWNAEARRPNSTSSGYLAGTDTDWRQQRSIPNQNRFPGNSSSPWNRWP